ncbi:MAG: hypothetical protein F6J87_19855 [Spirulina sp. SIO3F2]|nr:hypothetical protein [Spirulina sp. SIO3F2]
MSVDDRNWFQLIFDFRSSVIPGVFGQVLVLVIFAALVSLANQNGLPLSAIDSDSIGSLIPELVLGLLLVFRTDAAYTRFWEGSGIISDIVDLSRSLARSIWVYVDADDEAAEQEKIAHTRIVGLFLASVKQHLRSENVDAPMQALLTDGQTKELQEVNHMPLRITQWLSVYLKKMRQKGKLSDIMFTELNKILDQLTLSMGSCERILGTPLPLAYAIHLKHLLFLYFLTVPFKLVATLGWLTPLAVGVIAFALLGIEEIGLEIENPFGYDPNDLPLDEQAQELRDDIEEIIAGKIQPVSD